MQSFVYPLRRESLHVHLDPSIWLTALHADGTTARHIASDTPSAIWIHPPYETAQGFAYGTDTLGGASIRRGRAHDGRSRLCKQPLCRQRADRNIVRVLTNIFWQNEPKVDLARR